MTELPVNFNFVTPDSVLYQQVEALGVPKRLFYLTDEGQPASLFQFWLDRLLAGLTEPDIINWLGLLRQAKFERADVIFSLFHLATNWPELVISEADHQALTNLQDPVWLALTDQEADLWLRLANQVYQDNPFSSWSVFLDSYSRWLGQFRLAVVRETLVNRKFQEVTSRLLAGGLGSVEVSPIDYQSATITVDLSQLDYDTLDLFNRAKVSEDVPFIGYYTKPSDNTALSAESDYYKLWAEEDTWSRLGDLASVIVYRPAKALSTGSLFFTVKKNGNGRLTRDSYVKAYLLMEEAKLIVSSPLPQGDNLPIVLANLQRALGTSLDLSQYTIDDVQASFSLYHVNLEMETWLHMVMFDPILSYFLFGRETVSTNMTRQESGSNGPEFGFMYPINTYQTLLDWQVETQENARVRLVNRLITDNLPHPVWLADGTIVEKAMPNTPSVKVQIKRVSNLEVIPYLAQALAYLVNYYQQLNQPHIPASDNFLGLLIQEIKALDPNLNQVLTLLNQAQFESWVKFYLLDGGQPNSLTNYITGDQPTSLEIVYGILEDYLDRQSLSQIYQTLFPRVVVSQEVKPSRERRLGDLYPNIFTTSYARRVCQVSQEPVSLAPEEIDDFRQQTFLHDNTPQQRMVMPFPAENPIMWLGCPKDSAPFPALKANVLNNRDQYPYLPCCYTSPHYNPNLAGSLAWLAKPVKARETQHRLITNKVADVGKTAELPANLRRTLEVVLGAGRYVRVGVPLGKDALLHAALTAININYRNSSLEVKQELVAEVRQNWLTNQSRLVRPAALKQELYDRTEEQIEDELTDPDTWLDPALYYRAVEEYFNVSVYVFSTLEDRNGSLELPRHRVFHSRLRLTSSQEMNRQTVVIYKHWGSESNDLAYPHCEVIARETLDDNFLSFLFGPTDQRQLYQLTNYLNQVANFTLVDNSLVAKFSISQVARLVGWSQTVEGLFNLTAQSQVVDEYGKLRALNYDRFALIYPALQPLNLPMTDEVRSLNLGLEPDLNLIVSLNQQLSVIGLVLAGLSLSESEGQVRGLWYDLDLRANSPHTGEDDYLTMYAFLPLTGGLSLTTFQTVFPQSFYQADPPYFPSEAEVDVIRLNRQTERQALTILQLLIKGLQLYQPDVALDQTPADQVSPVVSLEEAAAVVDDFLGQVIVTEPGPYDFSGLDRTLPPLTSWQDFLTYLQTKTQGLVTAEGKLRLTGEAMEAGVVKFLIGYLRYGTRKEKQPLRVLTGYLNRLRDFMTGNHQLVFDDYSDINRWLSNQAEMRNRHQLRTTIDQDDILTDNPFLLQTQTNEFFLVQNVQGGEYLRALRVVLDWQAKLTNPGFNAEPLDQADSYQANIRLFSPGRETVELVQANTVEPSLNLLRYGDSGQYDYAALLSLS